MIDSEEPRKPQAASAEVETPALAIDARGFMQAEQLTAQHSLSGAELQKVFCRYKELESALEQTKIQLEEALKTSEMLKNVIVDVALDAVITIDDTDHIVEFNASAERIFGYQRAQVLGRSIVETIIPPEMRQQHLEGFQRLLSGAPSRILGRRVEVEGMHADGHNFPVELAVSEVRLHGRRLFTAYLRDLTEQKRTEVELAQHREERYQHEKLSAMGSLLAGVAHELNNPLSVVLGRSILLEMSAPDAETLEAAKEIYEATERCTRIIKTFLAMARKQKPEHASVQLNQVIESALTLVEYGLRTSGIQVKLELQPDLPALVADSAQLGQVVVNLVVNAQQALLESPEPRLLTITTRYMRAANKLRIEILDNGPGVPDAIRSRIFDPYYTTKPIGQGTGVGLSLSQGIIEAHGGQLTHESPANGGARFVITLPLTQAIVQEQPPQETVDEGAQGLTILVVDDENKVAKLIGDILKKAGHQVTLATSGNTALQFLEQQEYDLILSDVHMPDLNGLDFYNRLKSDYPHLCQRIAFITGDVLGTTVQRFLDDANCPWLSKPFTPAEILQLVGDIHR